MKRIYVIFVKSDGYANISEDGYNSLEKAQKFCQSRHGNIKQVTPMKYQDIDSMITYEIHEIIVN